LAKQLKPNTPSSGSKRKGFRLYPSDTNRLTKISLNLLALYLVVKIFVEVVYSNFFYLFGGDWYDAYRLYPNPDYWLVYLVMALAFTVIALHYFNKKNLGLIAATLTAIASFFESLADLGNTVDLIRYIHIISDYGNFPNMDGAFLFLFTGYQVAGILLIVSLALLFAGREDLRKILARNT
jgi:hypothetical protein